MYKYDELDKILVSKRVEQFKDQVNRRLKGELTEDEFKPLRLMNGLYLQLHAYMLRIAIPYGELSSSQMRKLSQISEKYDRGYGHFTTRQNIQLNWPKLIEVPDILEELSKVEMHAIQTSGNCIRNISADHLAGLTIEEIEDPRPWCEIIRKWSTFHPEFTFLPRKFKIAITGSSEDRAAIKVHDIGLKIIKKNSDIGFEVFVGGGQGRTPFIAKKIKSFVKKQDILSYLEAILRTYNELGRRDNIYKARIKILVHEIGIDKFKKKVENEWKKIIDSPLVISNAEIKKIKNFFKLPILEKTLNHSEYFQKKISENKGFSKWVSKNILPHKISGYSIVMVSLKPVNVPPGDVTSEQMLKIAEIADKYSSGEIRVTHEQNLVLPHVKNENLFKTWTLLKNQNLATPNIGLITDTICCPGMDYCALATARSIPISQRINKYFEDFSKQNNIGEIKIKISGCINACGHHHVGNIGILGLDRKGEEFYQITLGGSSKENSKIGEIIGPSFSSDKIIDAIDKIIKVYLKNRKDENEKFLTTLNLIGLNPFKEALYDNI